MAEDSSGESFAGPWRPFQRNIDPSFLLTRTKGQNFPRSYQIMVVPDYLRAFRTNQMIKHG